MRNVLLTLTLTAAIAGCAGRSQTSLTDEKPAPTIRPRDPWVFRSVLDGQPRMITIALADDLWVAYDAQTCSLRKVWAGGVEFTGSVYDTKHGPQPKAAGRVYWADAAEPSAAKSTTAPVPQAPSTGVKSQYRGYVFIDGGVEIHYTLTDADGASVRVTERPEVDADGTKVVLSRKFKVDGDRTALLRWLDQSPNPSETKVLPIISQMIERRRALNESGSDSEATGPRKSSFTLNTSWERSAK